MRIDEEFLSNLRFEDYSVICYFNEFSEAVEKNVLCINWTSTQFMKNSWCEGEQAELNGFSDYKVHLVRAFVQ